VVWASTSAVQPVGVGVPLRAVKTGNYHQVASQVQVARLAKVQVGTQVGVDVGVFRQISPFAIGKFIDVKGGHENRSRSIDLNIPGFEERRPQCCLIVVQRGGALPAKHPIRSGQPEIAIGDYSFGWRVTIPDETCRTPSRCPTRLIRYDNEFILAPKESPKPA